MSTNLFGTYEVTAQKPLIARPEGLMRKSIVLAPGQGNVAAGTVVYRDTDGLWKVAASGQMTSSYDVAVVEEATATGSVSTGTGYTVNALFAGLLVGSSLTFYTGTTLTAAIARVLRDKGIHLTNANIEGDGGYTETYGGLPLITIATQPANASVTAGAITGSLAVVASASDETTLTYQWYKAATNSNASGTAVEGATAATLTIPTSLTAGSHYYYCLLTAQNATLKTNVATVTVASGG